MARPQRASGAHAQPREPVICAFAVRCRREQADGNPVAETGMPNFDSGYDLRPGYGSYGVREGTRLHVSCRLNPPRHDTRDTKPLAVRTRVSRQHAQRL